MRVGFRTDASVEIGTGHVMRCLTLADALRQCGANSVFFCRPHAGHLMELIAQRGHAAVALSVPDEQWQPSAGLSVHAPWLGADWSRDAQETCQALGDEILDWMVVDHYALDQQWERVLRQRCQRLMVMDDLADRSHDCDLLLDQNLGRSAADYWGLVPSGCTLLIGTQFALLRPEFALYRPASLKRRAQPVLKSLLVAMGGVDKDNVTVRVLQALQKSQLPEDLKITVVMGAKAPWLELVQSQASAMNRPTQVLAGVSDMARLMMESDLAIGAAGGTSWERCCLGLPSLLVILADNQRAGAAALQAAGAAVALEGVEDIPALFGLGPLQGGRAENLRLWSAAAAKVTDGEGVSRVCRQLVETNV